MNTTLILVIAIFIAVGLAWVELFVRGLEIRKLRRRLDQTERQLVSVFEKQSGLRGTCDQLHARIDTEVAQLEQLRERQNQLDLRDPETGAYEQAIRLVRRGAGRQQLVADCGLTAAEADLILRLHAQESVGESKSKR